jgi:hypothetical protein
MKFLTTDFEVEDQIVFRIPFTSIVIQSNVPSGKPMKNLSTNTNWMLDECHDVTRI